MLRTICNPCLKNHDSYGLKFEMICYYLCQYKLPIAMSLKCSIFGMNCWQIKLGLLRYKELAWLVIIYWLIMVYRCCQLIDQTQIEL